MSKLAHSITCTSCADRGWVVAGRAEAPCDECETGKTIARDLERALTRPAPDRTDELRLLVDELGHRWTDPDKDAHAGLVVLVSVHDVPVHMETRSGKGGKVTGSPMPCAPDVTNLISDITTGVLTHEQNLRALLGMSRLRRSGTIRSAVAALDALPDLWAAAHELRPDNWMLTGGVGLRQGKPKRRPGQIERDLRSWHRQCRELLGASPRWSRVPTICSVCGQMALRQRPGDGSVVCTKCGEVWAEHELGWLDDVSGRTGT